MPSLLYSAGCDGVQPVAGLQHVQSQGHEQHVLRAFARVPCPPSLASGLPRVHAASNTTRHALRPPCPYTSLRIARPPSYTRQGASAFNKELNFDTSKVTELDEDEMFSVSPPARALSPL